MTGPELRVLLAGLLVAAAGAAAKAKDVRPATCAAPNSHRIGPAACLEIEPKSATDDLSLEANSAFSPEKLQDYCPNVVLVEGAARKRIALPETSFLYDTSDCCPATEIKLKVDARGRRFSISGFGRDCFGGTAHFDVEEFYSLDKAGKAKQIRKLDRSGALKPVPD